MPYSVLSLAGYLRQKGVSADICDLQLERKEDININRYDYFGFSLQFTGPQIKSALEAASYLRKNGARVPFIWGGIHATITAEQTAANEFVDFVVRGEGEEVLTQLILALDNNRDPKKIKGLTFKKNGEIINTSDADFIDLNTLSPIPFDLLKNLSLYSELNRQPSIVSIGTSRGCPYNCGFCYTKAVHRNKWRAMSAERVILEIKNILKYFHPDMLIANDDYFFANVPRSKKIAQKIIDEKLNIKWSATMRFNSTAYLNKDFLELLKRSGFSNPSVGGESGSAKILRMIDKKITVSQMEDFVILMKRFDFTAYANYMLGFPGEESIDILKTFSLIKKLSLKNSSFFAGLSVYTPYPGTPLYRLAIENGFKVPRKLEDWSSYQYNSVSNLPWLKGQVKSIIRTSSLFTHFSFNQKVNLKYSFPKKNLLYICAYFVLALSARLRWKYNFYFFPVEWRLYEYICKLFKISER